MLNIVMPHVVIPNVIKVIVVAPLTSYPVISNSVRSCRHGVKGTSSLVGSLFESLPLMFQFCTLVSEILSHGQVL
jgi:hypothetical protein